MRDDVLGESSELKKDWDRKEPIILYIVTQFCMF